jgi:hypothetical protein
MSGKLALSAARLDGAAQRIRLEYLDLFLNLTLPCGNGMLLVVPIGNPLMRRSTTNRASLGLVTDLLGEVERAFDQIPANPEACRKIGKRVRRKSLWRFPYSTI